MDISPNESKGNFEIDLVRRFAGFVAKISRARNAVVEFMYINDYYATNIL